MKIPTNVLPSTAVAVAQVPAGVMAGVAVQSVSPLIRDLVPIFLRAKSMSCLKKVVAAMRCLLGELTTRHGHQPIDQVSSLQIHQVVSIPRWGPRTQMIVLVVVKNFFHWARAEGYLPAHQPTAADSVRLHVQVPPPRFVLPIKLKRLLRSTREVDILLKAVLHAFGGLEDIELQRLNWENIQPKLGIVVPNQLPGRVRLVPLLRVLDAWLRPFYGCSGPVFLGWRPILKFRRWSRGQKAPDLIRELCNSYRVCRLAETGNRAKTAAETGLSIATLKQRFEPIAAGLGPLAKDHFSLTPDKVGLRNWPRMVKEYLAQNPPRPRAKTRKPHSSGGHTA